MNKRVLIALVAVAMVPLCAATVVVALHRAGARQSTAPTPLGQPSAMGRIEVVSPTTPAEHTFVTKGRVEGLPARGAIYFSIHHEEIPDFVYPDGTLGMKEMIMEMPVFAPGVSLEGLDVGDVVEMTFEMRYRSEPQMIVVGLRKLPADTPLKLGAVERAR